MTTPTDRPTPLTAQAIQVDSPEFAVTYEDTAAHKSYMAMYDNQSPNHPPIWQLATMTLDPALAGQPGEVVSEEWLDFPTFDALATHLGPLAAATWELYGDEANRN